LRVLPAARREQVGVFVCGAFATSAPAHHVDIEQLGEMRFSGTRHNMFRDKQLKARHAAAIAAEQERNAELRPRTEALARKVSEFAEREGRS
jgi:hypothetical protein